MILVLALLGQLLPVQALAEAGPQMPSSSELAAARALTGLAEDAPIYHAGMSVSSAMNAMQLSGWLDELLGNEMFSLQSAYQSIQTTLERMKAEDPGYYGIMTDTDNNRQYPLRIKKLYHQSEELREELAFYSHRLVEQSYIIDSMMERIGSDEYSDTEKARAARKLESAAETIREIRDTVAHSAAGWERQIDTWLSVLRGDYIGEDQETFVESSWVYLVMAWNPVITQAQVSTVSLYPKGETLLERLSPVRSALAETKQDVTLRVVSQKNFAISVKAAEGPIAGASVTVTQGGVSRTSETGSSGFEQGIAIFNVSDFQMDSGGCIELAMEVTAPSYRGFELRRVQLRKGQVLTYSLKKDDGSPYIYGASFQDNDILLEQYGIYYSPFNDLTRTISATVMSSGGVFCALKYTDASSGKTLYTDAKKAAGGKQTVEFTAKWLQTLKPGERVSFLLGSTEESVKNGSAGETPSMLSVQRGAVDKPFFDTTGAFTSAFVPTGTGFLGVTLPQSAPSFIAGSTLSIDFPFVKYWPRLIINVDGSFSFSLGGELKDLSPYDVVGEGEEKVARWKTEDQRSLERRQNDYVEQGEKLRYRAKIGAMWDGAKSKPVSFLELLAHGGDARVLSVLQVDDCIGNPVDFLVPEHALHGGHDGNTLNPVLFERLALAAEPALYTAAFVIAVFRTVGAACPTFTHHQPAEIPAKELGRQQVFLVSFRSGRGFFVALHPLLYPLKQVGLDDGRNSVRNHGVRIFVFADVLSVFEDDAQRCDAER